MNVKQFTLSATLILAATVIPPLHADVISDMASFDFSSRTLQHSTSVQVQEQSVTDFEILNLQRFDDSLGTLTAVDIWFESNWSLSSSIYATDTRNRKRSASGKGRSTMIQKIRLIDPWRETAKNKEVVISNCRDSSECKGYEYRQGEYDGQFDLIDFTMNDFIGPSPLKFKVERNLISTVLKCGTNDTCRQINSKNGWSGKVHVNYTYTVPEPSALALLGLGLVGIGMSRLRKRKV